MRVSTINGKKYIHVTSILELMSPFNKDSFGSWAKSQGLDPEWILKESNRIGTMVHNWVEDAVLGIKVFDVKPNSYEMGYREAVDRFLDKYLDKFEHTELPVLNKEFMYCGTLDAIVEGTIFDFKTYGSWKKADGRTKAKDDKVQKQLSLYNYALKCKYKQALVYFKADGSYDIVGMEYTDKPIKWMKDNAEKIRLAIEKT